MHMTNGKIAFLILAHADPKHLHRLCRTLGPKDDIFVHIDKRTDLSSFEGPLIPSNVKFTQRRIPVYWGDISVVEATLILLEEALRSKTPYLRLVLLSGSCYPIKKLEELRKYFIKKEHIDMVIYQYVRIFGIEVEGLEILVQQAMDSQCQGRALREPLRGLF
jgi:Core-2/I-Branching enzyme